MPVALCQFDVVHNVAAICTVANIS